MLGGQRDPVVAVALGEPGPLDEPGRAGLDRPVGLGPARRAGREPRRRLGVQDRVGEERAGAPGVRVAVVEDHALAATQTQHGVADSGHRGPLTHLDAQRARQLVVPHRRGQVAEPELERDGQHDVPLRVPLEPAGAVAEPTLGRCEGALHVVDAVPAPDRGDRVGDLLAVGADVLDR
jgi:hypothetical protein